MSGNFILFFGFIWIWSLTPWQWGGSVVRPTEGSTEALNSLRYSTRWIYNRSTDWPWNKVFILHLKAQFWLVVQEVILNWDSPPNLKLTSYPMWVRIELTSSNLIGSWKEVSLRLGGEFELKLTSWTTNQNWVFRQMRNKITYSMAMRWIRCKTHRGEYRGFELTEVRGEFRPSVLNKVDLQQIHWLAMK